VKKEWEPRAIKRMRENGAMTLVKIREISKQDFERWMTQKLPEICFHHHPTSTSMASLGYWGEISANYDWCEQNYHWSNYIAEFFNTISSIPIILAGIYFLRASTAERYGRRFVAAAVSIIVIGIGSVSFHGTLTRNGQMLDELPMLWVQ
jgi:hypothetical protein